MDKLRSQRELVQRELDRYVAYFVRWSSCYTTSSNGVFVHVIRRVCVMLPEGNSVCDSVSTWCKCTFYKSSLLLNFSLLVKGPYYSTWQFIITNVFIQNWCFYNPRSKLQVWSLTFYKVIRPPNSFNKTIFINSTTIKSSISCDSYYFSVYSWKMRSWWADITLTPKSFRTLS